MSHGGRPLRLYDPVMSETNHGETSAGEELAQLHRRIAASPQARADFSLWLSKEKDTVRTAIGQIESEQPDPLAPIDEQLAFMRRAAQIAARMELLAELDELLLSLGDDPVVISIRSSDLNALQIAADGLGLRKGQWGFDILLRAGCAQELVLLDDR